MLPRETFDSAIAHQSSLCEPTACASVPRPTFVSSLFTTSASGGLAGPGASAGANKATKSKTIARGLERLQQAGLRQPRSDLYLSVDATSSPCVCTADTCTVSFNRTSTPAGSHHA